MKKIYSFPVALILIIAFLSACNNHSSATTAKAVADSIKADPLSNLDSLINQLEKRDSIEQAFLQSANLIFEVSRDSIVYVSVIRMQYKKSLRKSEPYTDTVIYVRDVAPENIEDYDLDDIKNFGNFNGNNICGEYSDSGCRTIDEAANIYENIEFEIGDENEFIETKIIVKTDNCFISYCVLSPQLAGKNYIMITYRDQPEDKTLRCCHLQIGEGVFDQTFCQFRVMMEKRQLIVYEGNKVIFKKRFKTYGK